MKISCVINSVPRTFDADPSMKLRELLVQAGHVCVRDSDDSEGFCGSDTILMMESRSIRISASPPKRTGPRL
jgi:putative selenate reductase molybdopterin-binding subunit